MVCWASGCFLAPGEVGASESAQGQHEESDGAKVLEVAEKVGKALVRPKRKPTPLAEDSGEQSNKTADDHEWNRACFHDNPCSDPDQGARKHESTVALADNPQEEEVTDCSSDNTKCNRESQFEAGILDFHRSKRACAAMRQLECDVSI
jgi:hypothetical protein